MIAYLRMALVLMACAWAAAAQAHTRSQSFSTWTVDGDVLRGVYQVDAYRVTQLSETPQDLGALLRDRLAKDITATQAGTACRMQPPRSLASPRGDLRVELRFVCPKPIADAPVELVVGAFFDVSISHVHYIRIADGGVHEAVLTEGRNTVYLGEPRTERSGTFASFLSLGFEHVLSGVDHIAFLIALAMLAGGPWRIVLAVTGFTLGHSLTLALVAFDVLKPETAAVESLIGFTVAWAAGDALARWRNMPPWYGLVGAAGIAALPAAAWILGLPVLSWFVVAGLALFAGAMSYARHFDAPYVASAIAAIFGLAHGAGFAGPLLEMEIPASGLIWTLLSFNIGVELGQLTALAVLAGVLWILSKALSQISDLAFDATAAALFALGTFWFVSRGLA